VEIIFVEDSGMEGPPGGLEVVTKPQLGKCSINIIQIRNPDLVERPTQLRPTGRCDAADPCVCCD
jgi:hypothetical protein